MNFGIMAQLPRIWFIVLSTFLGGCCGGYGCDHAFSPNWEKRHKKFSDSMRMEVGDQYPTRLLCNAYFQPHTIENIDTTTYAFIDNPRRGCTYYCIVNKKTNTIIETRFEGSKEGCSETLN